MITFIKNQYRKIQLKRIQAEINGFEGVTLVYRIRKGWPYIEEADYARFKFFIRTEDGTEFTRTVAGKNYAREAARQYLEWLSEKWGLKNVV